MEDYIESLNDAGQEPDVEAQLNPDYDDGQESVVDSQDEAEEAEGAGEGAESAVAKQTKAQPKQSHMQNAAAKAARLRAQKETEERIRAEYDRKIAAAGLENPYTGRRMENFKEFSEYSEKLREERLAAEAKRTGKSVAVLREEEENRAFLSNLRRSAQQPQASANDTAKFDLAADADEFSQAFPDVDIVKLEQDKSFRRFAGTRLYKEPLAELYEAYLEVTKGAAQVATAKAQSREKRSTGGGTSGGEIKLTNAQQKELEAWNRKYPGMKMTAKEFFGR